MLPSHLKPLCDAPLALAGPRGPVDVADPPDSIVIRPEYAVITRGPYAVKVWEVLPDDPASAEHACRERAADVEVDSGRLVISQCAVIHGADGSYTVREGSDVPPGAVAVAVVRRRAGTVFDALASPASRDAVERPLLRLVDVIAQVEEGSDPVAWSLAPQRLPESWPGVESHLAAVALAVAAASTAPATEDSAPSDCAQLTADATVQSCVCVLDCAVDTLVFDAGAVWAATSCRFACPSRAHHVSVAVASLLAAGHRTLANIVLNHFVDVTQAYSEFLHLPGHTALACVKLACEAAACATPDASLVASALRAAAAVGRRPDTGAVVAVGGHAGHGKALVAKALASGVEGGVGGVVLASTAVRRQVAPALQSAYSHDATEAAYHQLTEQAVHLSSTGGAVVVLDGTFFRGKRRRDVERACAGAGVRFLGLWVVGEDGADRPAADEEEEGAADWLRIVGTVDTAVATASVLEGVREHVLSQLVPAAPDWLPLFGRPQP